MGSHRRSRRVLVVGWGFLGAALGNRMRDEGLEVRALTRTESTRTHAARLAGISVVIGDAGDPAILAESMEGVDHVLCAAGELLPVAAAEQPLADAQATLAPLLTILEHLRHHPRTSLAFLSSGGTVYGNPKRVPAREDDPAEPISSYGVSRLAGELYAAMYAHTYGFPVQIFRLSNVYGPGQSPDRSQGAVAVFIHRIAAGLPLQIVGDGSAMRDYVHVADVAEAVTRVVAEDLDVGTVNVGSGRGHTVLAVARQVGEIIGAQPLLDFLPARSHDVASIVLDVTKLTSFLDYAPIDLQQGLQLTWHHVMAGQLAADRVTTYPPVVQVVAEADGLEPAAAAS